MRAGNIDFLYESGFLRYLKINGTEVLRMIYFAVRDANWGNYKPTFYDEKIDVKKDSFQINYKVKYTERNEDFFKWNISINGLNNNQIHFEITGETLKEFSTNRVGFCVLHPIEKLASQKLEILHSNGEIIEYNFPKFISPQQPFVDIVGMKWAVEKNEFELDFTGDIFETEDQRNWGDSSYKTYCTPLNLPFPKLMKVGDKVYQKVVFKAKINEDTFKLKENLSEKANKFNIGICESIATKTLSKKGIENLKALQLSHYRIEVYFSKLGWKNKLIDQINIANTLEIPLEIVLVLGTEIDKEINEFINATINKNLIIKNIILLNQYELVTNRNTANQIPNLKASFTNTKIGVGTNFNFTEINRNRIDYELADFISISFDPQQHAFDDLTIIENAEAVKYIVESATEIHNKPIHLSPIFLKRRFNPYATDPAAINIPIENQMDSRQKSVFLANWVDILIKHLAISGVESISIFQTHGQLGVMDDEGNPYPVYESLKSAILGK
jgi:D-apionolactonase